MKRIITIIVVLTLVLGSGFAGLVVMDVVPNPLGDSEAEMAEGTGGEPRGKPAFVPPERAPMLYPLEDIVIPVILDARVIKRIYITARMEIAQGNRPAVENGLPRMESRLTERLVVYFQKHYAKNRRLNPRGIKKEMVAAAHDVYGDKVSDVLLITVFEQ